MSLPDGYETRFYAKVRQRHERERAEKAATTGEAPPREDQAEGAIREAKG